MCLNIKMYFSSNQSLPLQCKIKTNSSNCIICKQLLILAFAAQVKCNITIVFLSLLCSSKASGLVTAHF